MKCNQSPNKGNNFKQGIRNLNIKIKTNSEKLPIILVGINFQMGEKH